MTTQIALLRGINVGGNNIIKMAELRVLLTSLGYGDVRTYIQSGNCIFQSDAEPCVLQDQIAQAIEAQYGFRPAVLVMSADLMQAAVDASPFPEVPDDPKSLHLYFLSTPAEAADLAKLEALKIDSENYHLTNTVFYLNTPEGMARSKLGAGAEKALGVAATARNLNSVLKILELAKT